MIKYYPDEIDYQANNRKGGLYFIYDQFETLMYIGKTNDFGTRLYYKRIFKEFLRFGFGYILLSYEKDETARNNLEKKLITIFRPPLNMTYNENKYKLKNKSMFATD